MTDKKNINEFEKDSLILNESVDNVIIEASNNIIDIMLSLYDVSKLKECIVIEIIRELDNNTFFSYNVELTEEQKKTLHASPSAIVQRSLDSYKAKLIKTKEAEEEYIINLQNQLKLMIEKSVVAVGEAINRGAVVPSKVAKCDITNDEKKKIELHYNNDVRLTVPTNGFFVSSNCIEVLKNSVNFFKKI